MYVKAAVLQAFTDTSIMIRNAAGHDIVAFLGALEPRNWPECLQQLVTMLDSPELDRQEVSVVYLDIVILVMLESRPEDRQGPILLSSQDRQC